MSASRTLRLLDIEALIALRNERERDGRSSPRKRKPQAPVEPWTVRRAEYLAEKGKPIE